MHVTCDINCNKHSHAFTVIDPYTKTNVQYVCRPAAQVLESKHPHVTTSTLTNTHRHQDWDN